MKKNFALLIISSFIVLAFAEWILRISGRPPFIVNPEQKQFWKFDEDLGWAHRPNQTGLFVKNNLRHEVQINSKGLRDDNHDYENGGGTPNAALEERRSKRILVLGDSFAWGFGVEQQDRFSEQLEEQLEIEVINAGVSGYSTDQELLWYQIEGHKYKVDAVILLFCGNDESDNYKSRNYIRYNKPRYEQEYSKTGLRLVDEKVRQPNILVQFNYWAMQQSSFYYQFVKLYRQIIVPKFAIKSRWQIRRDVDENAALTRNIIAELSEQIESNGSKFLMVTTNSYWQEDREFSYDDFIKRLREDGHKILDVSANESFEFEAMTLHGDQHWNQRGHSFVAELIAETLDSSFLQINNTSINQP